MASSSSQLRIGIVGAGANTRERHIPGLRAMSGVEIVGVANRTPQSSQKAAKELGIPRAFDSWEQLVASGDIDAVCIGTWPYMHCPVTLAALASNKHVLCEARMAMNLAEARAMLAASQARPELIAQVVPAPMTLGVDAEIKARVDGWFLGQLVSVDMRVAGATFVDRQSPMHWRQDRELSGLNVLAMGIWYESLLRWIPPVRRVMARTKVVTTSRHDPRTNTRRDVLVPEHVEVIGDHDGGATFHLQISSVTGLNDPGAIWLFGADGTLKYDVSSDSLWAGKRGEKTLSKVNIAPDRRGAWRVEEEFVSAIRGKEKITRTSFRDAERYMAFTDAVARSAAEGRMVFVEE